MLDFYTKDVVIASGASNSTSVDLASMNSLQLVGVVTPGVWTAADIKLQHSLDDATWTDVTSAGSDVQKAALANETIVFTTGETRPCIRYIRLASIVASGTAAANQAAERTLILILRSVT